MRRGQRLTGMSGNQSSLPLVGSPFAFRQHGESGAWVSELLPHFAKIVDEVAIVRSMYTSAINHDPAITFLQTGSERAGLPSLPAWLDYGLGPDQPEPARECRARDEEQGGPTALRAPVGRGFPPVAAPGSAASHPAPTPCCTSRTHPGSTRERARRHARRRSARCTPTSARARATRRSIRARRSTSSPIACRRRSPTSSICPERARTRCSSSTAKTRVRPARTPPTACSHAASSSATCASCSSSTKGGTSTGHCPGGLRTQCRETDQARPRGSCSWTSSGAACSTTRSSSGAVSSAARATRRAS